MNSINTILLVLIIAQVGYLIYKQAPQKQHSIRRNASFIDTSALMDGRIVTAAQTGFIPQNLVVPKSVVAELQYLADQADAEKRLRARRGLDAISELQAVEGLRLEILDDGPTDQGGVDERLIELAKKYSGSICTIDFNLNKVATVQGITVLNINELAGSIRMAFLPGESLQLALTQKGQESSQAVGYLADGTMVVVDKASQFIGQTAHIEVIRSLQTAAGRMLFAKLPRSEALNQKAEPTRKNRTNSKPTPTDQPKSAQTSNGNVTEQTTRKPQSAPNRRRSKRGGEDSLVELINKQ